MLSNIQIFVKNNLEFTEEEFMNIYVNLDKI